MIKPLLCVVALGAALGFMLPTGPSPAPEPAVAERPVPAAKQAQVFEAPEPQDTVLERRSSGHFYVTATVNNTPIDFVVDTGASTVALTQDDAHRLGLNFNPAEFEVIGRSASGDIRGTPVMIDVIDIDGKRVPRVPAAILEGLEVSLLGQTYLSRINAVQMNGDRMVLR
jgi:aspartyl protease family protein